jgi:hypothetical protein
MSLFLGDQVVSPLNREAGSIENRRGADDRPTLRKAIPRRTGPFSRMSASQSMWRNGKNDRLEAYSTSGKIHDTDFEKKLLAPQMKVYYQSMVKS